MAFGVLPGSWSTAHSSCAAWLAVFLLLSMLRWLEMLMSEGGSCASPLNKLVFDTLFPFFLPGLVGREGRKVEKEVLMAGCSSTWPWSSNPCAEHTTTGFAMTSGRYGGPSATSKSEAFLQRLRWSLAHLSNQVVRPRFLRCGQRWRFLAGVELTSNLLTAMCGGGIPGPDCFLFSVSGVFFIKAKVLFSNIRVSRVSVVKDPAANCTCHVCAE